MDLIFGDTAAYEEKRRIVQIEAALRGTNVFDKKFVLTWDEGDYY